MKTLKKSWIALLVVAVAFSLAAVIAVAVSPSDAGTLERLDALIAEVNSAATAKDKATKLAEVSSYLTGHTFADDEVETAQERFEKLCEQVSEFTVKEVENTLDGIVQMTNAKDARMRLTNVQELLAGKGYIDSSTEDVARLIADANVVNSYITLTYIGMDQVKLRERGETLRSFFNEIAAKPLDENSKYYTLCMEKREAVVDKTINLLYGELENYLTIAEDAEKTDDERMAATEDFRVFCKACYFDTARKEYIALTDRCGIVEGRIYLGKINAAETIYDKGVLLKEAVLLLAKAAMVKAEGDTESPKAKFFADFETKRADVTEALYKKAQELLDTATAKGAENPADLLAEYDKYLDNCYFADADARTDELKQEKRATDAILLLYAVEDAGANPEGGVVAAEKALKVLVVFLNENTVDAGAKLGKTFYDKYNGETGVYEETVGAFYDYLGTLTEKIAAAAEDFEAARLAKDTLLSLAEDAYFLPATDERQVEYLADLAATECGFGTRAVDWAIEEFEKALAMTDTAAKRAKVEEVAATFDSYGIVRYDDPKTKEETAFNAKYDTYTDTHFYAVLDTLADDAIAAEAKGVEDLGEYFTAIKKHLATYSYDKKERWMAYETKTLDVRKHYGAYLIGEANRMCDEAEQSEGAAVLAGYNKLSAFYRSHDFYEDQSYFDFLDRLQALSERAAVVLEEVKAKLEAEVPLSEYADTSENLFTFESGKVTGANTSAKNRVYIDSEHGGYQSDKCMTIVYEESLDTYYTWSITGAANNCVVLEFDITTFTDMPAVISLQTGASSKSKGRVYPQFFSMKTSNGQTNLYTKANGGTLLKEDIIQQGVWTHIAMSYDPATKYVQLYVNYEKVGAPYKESVTGCIDWELTEGVRLGTKNATGSVSYDNLRFYKGTVPRNVNRFLTMASDDKFLLFADLLEKYHEDKSSTDITNVSYAYTQMSALLSGYWSSSIGDYTVEDEALRHAVDVYLATDKASIDREMNNVAFKDLQKYYESLVALDGDIDAIDDRTTLLKQIDDYISANEDSLDMASDEYKDLAAKIEEESARLTIDTRVKNFDDAIKRFERAPSLAAMNRHYESCKEAYGDGFDAATLARFKNLPSLIEKYNGFASDIDAKVKEANSKSIVECMRYVAQYTEEEYEEKYEEINKYILVVRDLVTPNADGTLKYKTGYLGVTSAVRLYNKVNDFFYQKLQLEHIEKLSTELNKYLTLDSYIEKQGVCIYIRNYVATNDVDENNAEIRRIIESCAVYEEELGIKDGVVDPDLPNYQLEKYKKLIEQNTEYFVDTVSRMAFLESYVELKEMYDDVMKIYYYMNIDSEKVQAAIEEFSKYQSILREMETHSELFIKAMEDYKAAENATDRYKALSKAYTELTLGANEYYEGISDAMAMYRTAADAYNAKAEIVNDELSSAVSVMCTARADIDGVKYVIAAFRKRYE